MSYQVLVPEPIAKTLRELPKEIRGPIGFAMHCLAVDARPQGSKKLKGKDNRYRIRVGDWRVIYSIEDQKLIVLVLRVADRKNVYQK
jgi:mRNA interferase RelE/StbE